MKAGRAGAGSSTTPVYNSCTTHSSWQKSTDRKNMTGWPGSDPQLSSSCKKQLALGNLLDYYESLTCC